MKNKKNIFYNTVDQMAENTTTGQNFKIKFFYKVIRHWRNHRDNFRLGGRFILYSVHQSKKIK